MSIEPGPLEGPAVPRAGLSVLGPTELTRPDGRPVRSGTIQAKRLVLLAFLCCTQRRAFVRRDTLLGLFWPELSTDQARHALRQSLHYLRSTLGHDVVVGRGDEEVASPEASLWCDTDAFEARLHEGDSAGALALYRGELLEGVFVADAAPELEQWLDAERTRFRRLAVRAAREAAARAEQSGNSAAAPELARRAVALDREDETSLRALMELLERRGERADALRAYSEFAQWLADEHGAEPAEPTRALRARLGVTAPPILVEPPVQTTITLPASVPTAAPSPSRRARWVATAAALATVVVLSIVASRQRAIPLDGEMLAVGGIREAVPDSTGASDAAAALRSLLATNLARLSGVRVVSEARLHELVARAGGSINAPEALAAAARRAGASELLEGNLTSSPAGYRLDLQRLDLADGTIRSTVTLDGRNLGDLVAQATSRIAAAYHVAPPPGPVGGMTSRSQLALHSYQQGVGLLHANKPEEAMRSFRAALQADPGFVPAAFWAAQLGGPEDDPPALLATIVRAAQAADTAPELQRLYTRSLWAWLASDPSMLSVTESLATRYPANPEGRYLFATALARDGNWAEALEQYRASIAADSAQPSGAAVGAAPCFACISMVGISTVLIAMDSVTAAERWLHLVRLRNPLDRTTSVFNKVQVLEATGRRSEALALMRDSLDPAYPPYVKLELEFTGALRAGDFDDMERLLAEAEASDDPGLRWTARWWEVIYLRTRGRLAAALAAADRACPESLGEENCAQIRGSIMVDMGRPADAIPALREQLARSPYDSSGVLGSGLWARRKVWLSLHLGVALAASGDTTAVRLLADTMARIARLSGYGRDRRMPYHLRGLIWSARGQHAQAASAFRNAQWSATYGYTNSDYHLARALVRLGRPAEAVAVMEPAQHRVLTSMGMYLSQADVHAVLAQALYRAGRRDEAIRHLRWAEAAWAGADPAVRERLKALQQEIL